MTSRTWYLFSTPDPAVYVLDRGDRPRQVLRIVVVINAAVSVLSQTVEVLGSGWGPPGGPPTLSGFVALASLGLGILSLGLWVVQFFAAMKYLRWLARRIPSPTLERAATRNMWLLPVLYVPGMIVCIGPLIALILYYNFLDEFRKALKKIKMWQAASEAV